mmetsp:Transcript_33373/g.51185  ORF Transcript_33373/g.51185 Transcript_33373/m.51185 type:complete len:221 (-) Transcript_33373:267-929(-)
MGGLSVHFDFCQSPPGWLRMAAHVFGVVIDLVNVDVLNSPRNQHLLRFLGYSYSHALLVLLAFLNGFLHFLPPRGLWLRPTASPHALLGARTLASELVLVHVDACSAGVLDLEGLRRIFKSRLISSPPSPRCQLLEVRVELFYFLVEVGVALGSVEAFGKQVLVETGVASRLVILSSQPSHAHGLIHLLATRRDSPSALAGAEVLLRLRLLGGPVGRVGP